MAGKTSRSLQLTTEQQANANSALSKFGSKADLAAALGMSRTTINNFFQGKPVQRKQFHAICKKLKLDWQPESSPSQNDVLDIDQLVREMRSHIQPLIQQRCGTMRVLEMTQQIDLDKIYTHVNILEKITGRNRRGLAELLQELSPDLAPEKFERFSLGDIKKERVPGLKAVEKHSKLMILGKPGAGKTTFLKHLAMQCMGGRFQGDHVPIFITLKDFAEEKGTPDLLTYINSLPIDSTKVEELQIILENGRALILLDGLDEVRETDAKRVLCQIKQFSERNAHNTFVITCRIAAREYIFEQFTEVEVADFDDAQIADVSGKWFHCKQDEVKAKRFLEKLKENPPIRELASSPLLLTLLCLVFEDSGDFPANRAELYENGVDVLLKKWDSKRNIERDQVYKKLSLKRKEDLLSQIAYSTFETGNYFFKQKDVEGQIREFIENLPGASTDEETLNLDSEAVLKSIEAQHGLFVERAWNIYSFSHLTFHEYFAAREIKEKSYLNVLSENLTDKRWREVILLTVGMLPNADVCLLQMKRQIDGLIAEDEKLQRFLVWVDEKARSVNASKKPAAIRAFYLTLTLDFTNANALAIDNAFARFVANALDLNIANANALAIDIDLDDARDHAIGIDHALTHALDHAIGIYHDIVIDIDQTIPRALDFKGAEIDPELKLKLEILSSQLPDSQLPDSQLPDSQLLNIQEAVELIIQWWIQWWQENGQTWINQLRAVMIEHRNIGHDWQFNNAQKERLQQYYDANQLLVDCLNSDCYISRSVREEIEATLLLPI